ncbi:hypothetical protein SUDANB176_06738 [Streptomyces sp. enrichment culture]
MVHTLTKEVMTLNEKITETDKLTDDVDQVRVLYFVTALRTVVVIAYIEV